VVHCLDDKRTSYVWGYCFQETFETTVTGSRAQNHVFLSFKQWLKTQTQGYRNSVEKCTTYLVICQIACIVSVVVAKRPIKIP
jgi:hypothetical protein